ncbi:VOC family protein [Microbulbifer sp. CAU 1566]|uniref:VOC family protein n=1 Tax=Microbulbifer sp. CAU 1566 TaxID=2933269 RepID=UPI002005F80A|nr:VOC family protein [Microbulbifer sp. CAU 1566]MCK7598375.1 VOC family protein [Microbulbifer sp. CAU 1566]
MAVSPIPEGMNSVTPYLCVKGAAKALAFYTEAFGATELFRMPGPGGLIMHAELQLGDTRISIADHQEEYSPLHAPQDSSPVGLLFYTEKVDEVFANAIKHGATALSEPADQFYGDRSGTLKDPFGMVWFVATHIEDVPEEELAKRAAEMG